MTKHSQSCSAPICVEDYNDNLVWYAGEEICSKVSRYRWQAMQKRINKYISKGNTVRYSEEPLNVRLLETRTF